MKDVVTPQLLDWLKSNSNNIELIKNTECREPQIVITGPLSKPEEIIKISRLHIKYGGDIILPKRVQVTSKIFLDHPEISSYTATTGADIVCKNTASNLTIKKKTNRELYISVYKTDLNLTIDKKLICLKIYADNVNINVNSAEVIKSITVDLDVVKTLNTINLSPNTQLILEFRDKFNSIIPDNIFNLLKTCNAFWIKHPDMIFINSDDTIAYMNSPHIRYSDSVKSSLLHNNLEHLDQPYLHHFLKIFINTIIENTDTLYNINYINYNIDILSKFSEIGIQSDNFAENLVNFIIKENKLEYFKHFPANIQSYIPKHLKKVLDIGEV